MNKILLIGRLTKDIEMSKTTTGIDIAKGCIAVKRPYSKETSDFINIKGFKGTAVYMSYASKGDLVAIEGYITINAWDDTNGQKHYMTEVIVDNLEYCEKKKTQEEKIPTDAFFNDGNNNGGFPF